MFKLERVVDSSYLGLCFFIKDDTDDSIEAFTRFDIYKIVDSNIITIENLSIKDNELSYPEELYTSDVDDKSLLGDDSDSDVYDDYEVDDEEDYDEEYEEDDEDFIEDDDYEEDEENDNDEEDFEEEDDWMDLIEEDEDDDESGVISKLYDMLEPEQVNLLKKYYMWYAERVFTRAQQEENSNFKVTLNINKRIDYRELKKGVLDSMRGNSIWKYAGFVHYRHKGDILCDVQVPKKNIPDEYIEHRIKNAHIVWKVENITEDVEHEVLDNVLFGVRVNDSLDDIIADSQMTGDCLVFGENCLSHFFGIPKEGMDIIKHGQRESTSDMKLMYNIMNSEHYQEALESFKVSDDFYTEFEAIDLLSQMIGEGRLFKYDKLLDFYLEFRGINGDSKPMIPPKTLMQELRDSLLGWYSHKFVGGIRKLTSNSVLFKYIDKLYSGEASELVESLQKNTYMPNSLNYTVLSYIDALFSYELCGFYKYNAKKSDEVDFASYDEGGRSKQAKAELQNLYYNLKRNFFSDFEYSKAFLYKIIKLYKLKVPNPSEFIPTVKYYTCDSEIDEQGRRVYVSSETKLNRFDSNPFRDFRNTDEAKKYESCISYLLFRGTYDLDNYTIDSYYDYLKTVSDLLPEFKNAFESYAYNKAEEEVKKCNEREERRYKEELEREKEEKRRKEEQEEEERKRQEQLQQINDNADVTTREELVSFLDKFDYSSVDTNKLTNYDFRINKILRTVVDKQSGNPTDRQFWHLKSIYEEITGKSFDDKEKGSGSPQRETLDADVMDKIKYLLDNKGTYMRDNESRTFDILESVRKYGTATPRQMKYVKMAEDMYKERVTS